METEWYIVQNYCVISSSKRFDWFFINFHHYNPDIHVDSLEFNFKLNCLAISTSTGGSTISIYAIIDDECIFVFPFSKKWSQSYVKLFGSNIAFYRDQRAAAQVSGSKNGNPEMIFNLQNAKCEIAPKEWSSKKNVFMVNILIFQDFFKNSLKWHSLFCVFSFFTRNFSNSG